MLPGRREIFDRSRLQQHGWAGAQLEGGEHKATRLSFFYLGFLYTICQLNQHIYKY